MTFQLAITLTLILITIAVVLLACLMIWKWALDRRKLEIQSIYVQSSKTEGPVNIIITYKEHGDDTILAIRGVSEPDSLWNFGAIRVNKGKIEFKTRREILPATSPIVQKVLTASKLVLGPSDKFPESPDLSW